MGGQADRLLPPWALLTRYLHEPSSEVAYCMYSAPVSPRPVLVAENLPDLLRISGSQAMV